MNSSFDQRDTKATTNTSFDTSSSFSMTSRSKPDQSILENNINNNF